ncbi:MAG TPA: hypothetical protein VMO47_11375, partial [Rhodothermales bacterium]|nr:hypothetical protein [Rhodothermales bacterium]
PGVVKSGRDSLTQIPSRKECQDAMDEDSHAENAESAEKRIVESGQSPQASAWGNEPTHTFRAGLQPGEDHNKVEDFHLGAEAPGSRSAAVTPR